MRSGQLSCGSVAWVSPILMLVASAALAQPASPKREPSRPSLPAPAPVKLAKIEDFAPPSEFVTIDGVKTHFVKKGDHGLAVVLVHGFGASTYSWRSTIAALAKDFRVYALDMKGFGLSTSRGTGSITPTPTRDTCSGSSTP